MSEFITIVDENDNILGSKERSLLGQNDIHRVVEIWITNNHNQLLLAQRAFTKRWGAGMWGPSAAGLVVFGESYDDCVRREVVEELGVHTIKPTYGPKELRHGTHSYIVQHFIAHTNEPAQYFKPDPNEVAKVAWFDMSDLAQHVAADSRNFLPFILGALKHLEHRN